MGKPYWHEGMNGTWIGSVLMLVFMGLLWGGLLAVVVVVMLRRFAKSASGHDDALRILNERFAHGEIDKEEYEQRRTTIRH